MFVKLIKLSDRLNQSGLLKMANRVDKFILSLAQEAGGNIDLVELIRLKPEVIMSLGKAISFDLVLEPDPDGRGNMVRAIPKIHDKWTDGLNLGDISDTPELQTYMVPEAAKETIRKLEEGGWFEEGADLPTLSEEEFEFDPKHVGREKDLDEALSGTHEVVENRKPLFTQEDMKSTERKMASVVENKIRSVLVKMADEFDQERKFDLASEVDRALKSFSARPKAPLKKLDDKVKKNLIIFVHDADQNNSKSIKSLNELFRRLRYFDFSDSAKDLGLDKIVKDMEKTQEGLESAKKRFFELMHGKKPSKKDLEEMFNNIVDAVKHDEGQNTLDFFDANSDDEKAIDAEDSNDECDSTEEVEMSDEMEEELEKFLEGIEEDEED
jgi:hypothetical protein